MKVFLGVIGFISWIMAGIVGFTGMDIYTNSSTIMQQGVGMDHLIYSGLLFVAGAVCLSVKIDPLDYRGQLDSINKNLHEMQKKLDK